MKVFSKSHVLARLFGGVGLLEILVLIFTAAFVVVTLAWFHLAQPTEPVTITTANTASQEELSQAGGEDEDQPDAPGLLPGEVLDLNTVSAEDLTRLPGIGDSKAEAIVAWRRENGPFTSVDQLLEVKGIGEKILAQIAPYVTVTP
jgi:competence protein ComEA